jgi:MFS superfamily sulfate permease-like transporter
METFTPKDWETIGTGLGVLFVVGAFLPTVIALWRRYSNAGPVVVLNLGSLALLWMTPKLLLIFPVMLWVVALAWALAHDLHKPKEGKKWNPRPDEPGGSLWRERFGNDYQPKRGDGGPRREIWK